VFCEHGRDPALAATEFMTMVRSKDWKLVHFIDDDFGQLFDLKNDPAEVENLWNCNPEKRAELLSDMYRWRMQSQLRTRDWTQRWR
jgi:arylsulfatase A-like enzyme